MKIRIHTGGFKESMDTVRDIEPTKEAIAEYANEFNMTDPHWGNSITPNMIDVEDIGMGVDARNGWHTRLVLIMNQPFGWCDRPVDL